MRSRPTGPRAVTASVVAAAVVLASSTTAAAASPHDEAWAALEQQLDALVVQAAEADVTLSITVTDLSGRFGEEPLTAGGDEQVKAASVIKLPLLALLMDQVDSGDLSLDTVLTIPAGDSNIVGGAGTLQHRDFPVDIDVAELMELMVQVSDNTATNVLIDVAGGFDAVNEYIGDIGLEELYLGRKMISPAVPPLQENYITSSAVTELLVMLWEGDILSRASSDHIIGLMAGQLVDTKYGAVIPREHLANKTGELGDVSHDSGYVTVPGKEVALTTTTAFTDLPRTVADAFVQQSASLVYAFARATVFSDVPSDHPFHGDIRWMADAGLSVGYADGTFRPSVRLSRQAMAAFLHRYAGDPDWAPAPGAQTFSDVPASHPFFTEIEWLAAHGLAAGYGDGTFGPGVRMSRQAMAAFIYRLSGVEGYEPDGDWAFSDVDGGHPFATEIQWMFDAELSAGYRDGTFDGSRGISRQATAAFLHRYDGWADR